MVEVLIQAAFVAMRAQLEQECEALSGALKSAIEDYNALLLATPPQEPQ